MQSTVTQLIKVPSGFRKKLDGLLAESRVAVKVMLSERDKSSSKFYPDIPCVIAARGNEILSGGEPQDSVSLRRGLLVAPSLGHDYA